MGICASSVAAAVAPFSTAKLILSNGELREFAKPVKASQALQKDAGFFICDADEMEFGEIVSAVPADVELCVGQIYFVLPRSMLRQALQAADLATLAAKASSALIRGAPGGERPLVFTESRQAPTEKNTERKKKRRAGGTGREFESNLCSIME